MENIEYVGSKIMICVVFAFLHTQVRSIYFSGENVVMVTNDRLNLDIVGGCLQPGNVHPMDTKNILVYNYIYIRIYIYIYIYSCIHTISVHSNESV